MSNQTPSIGRIVHYVLDDGTIQPAIIVAVWSPENGCSNLQVFLDGTNVQQREDKRTGVTPEEAQRGFAWRTSRARSDEPKPGYWHWPPYVAPKVEPPQAAQ